MSDTANARLVLRVRGADKALIESAASHEGVTVAAFVRRVTLSAARKVLRERASNGG